MKNSEIFIVFLIGLIITVFGVVFKFMDWYIASLLLIVGMTFEAVAVGLLLYKILK